MSSLSKASEGNQTIKMFLNCKMISPIVMNRASLKTYYFTYVYHTLEKHPLPTKKPDFYLKQNANSLHLKPKCINEF